PVLPAHFAAVGHRETRSYRLRDFDRLRAGTRARRRFFKIDRTLRYWNHFFVDDLKDFFLDGVEFEVQAVNRAAPGEECSAPVGAATVEDAMAFHLWQGEIAEGQGYAVDSGHVLDAALGEASLHARIVFRQLTHFE